MLNPLTYTEKIVSSFLRYQLTAYPFADEHLNGQMRKLLSLNETRRTPLLKGPYISLSRAFRFGASVEDFIREGIFHPHMRQIIPYPSLYGHQDAAIRSVRAGKTTLVSTGTGSGKSECFLYPIISRCLELRDQKAPAGIVAVIVYPMNALAEDQLGRLRELLAGSGVTFGMYVGKTPQKQADVTGYPLKAGASREDYRRALSESRQQGHGSAIHPAEEVCSREIMRTPGKQPSILLTNIKQLELLLTRHQDVELFDNAQLEYLVFDEAHTFSGAEGAETACLIRRLRTFCGRAADQTACIATSATMVDPSEPMAACGFAARFFGVDRASVVTVNEAYEADTWAGKHAVPAAQSSAPAFLEDVRRAVDAAHADAEVRAVLKARLGVVLPAGDWEAGLFDWLSENELLFQGSELLQQPMALPDFAAKLAAAIGRPVPDEEIIAWFILGAAARRDGRPLVRPVVHGFIRGIPGAVVTFEEASDQATLLLSAEDDPAESERKLRMPVSTCTTCGQHYFASSLADFHYTDREPGGGKVVGGEVYWEPQEQVHGGTRVVFTDRLISADEEDEGEDHPKLTLLYLCRTCGAAHRKDGGRCLACGAQGKRLPLKAVQQKAGREGYLHQCVCCGSHSRNYAGRIREPAKPVRAVNVADVHVLAQDMIHHAERKRLLVFADNRQDAAFQAGWMRDHARRFRLRAIMARVLAAQPCTVGDLVQQIDKDIGDDEHLSRALLPEVWQVEPDPITNAHKQDRRRFLRYQVLLELTMGPRERLGLEPWGRLGVAYENLDETKAWIKDCATWAGMTPGEMVAGVAALVDVLRRRKILYDEMTHVFDKILAEGSEELMHGFLPELPGVPKGVKLQRDAGDDKGRVEQWLSTTGHRTSAMQVAIKWGVPSDEVEGFLRKLWAGLIESGILTSAKLSGSRGNNLPGCFGTYQVNLENIRLSLNRTGFYRCRTCRRVTSRMPPRGLCLAWRCSGTVESVPEDSDNYDLQLVDGNYSLLRPREHTAMVPTEEREKLENIFKGESDVVNAIVCTQTLEMGVDIGSLDAVLMRNVPPLASNYWQRVGRAGRRHRMAVDLTYCRAVSHDRAYFLDPIKMLGGRVEPPNFNLSNGLMVAKHVHATVLTVLHQLARPASGLSESQRNEIHSTLRQVFPTFVRDYLFQENGDVRQPEPLSVAALGDVVRRHEVSILKAVLAAFGDGWPTEDLAVVTEERLQSHIRDMAEDLGQVVSRLYRRLRWALSQMAQLDVIRGRTGTLDEERKSFYERCDRFVKRMKGQRARRGRREAEGVDDTLTISVLAAEGFLPGYGLEVGAVVGYAEVPKWVRGLRDFSLPRPPGVAVREYVPGNLIYANGQRFVPRRFMWDANENRPELLRLSVNMARQSVVEHSGVGGDGEAGILTALPISDVTLVHQSRISDEEENRFQMGVNLFGREVGQHRGGIVYQWGERTLLLRKGVRLQLVNVGTPSIFNSRQELGYPVCRACGQSVSPFSSERQREEFYKNHAECCGVAPGNIGFYADLTADVLTLPECRDRTEAYSVMEGLRFAATEVLNMDVEDLQVMVIGHPDRDECDALLYDPMPGGSGLIEQLCSRFAEVVAKAQQLASDCPGRCVASCVDCFRTYRNAGYHKYLDRTVLLERITSWGAGLEKQHDIPPRQPSATPLPGHNPVGEKERCLRDMVKALGFPDGRWQENLRLPHPLGSTTPDVTFDDPHEPGRRIFIYLDGLSEHIHGNATTRQSDLNIRNELRAEGHEVVEIPASHLDDRNAMSRHFRRLARFLMGPEAMERVTATADAWFPSSAQTPANPAPVLRVVEGGLATAWKDCVPRAELQVAAGQFSSEQGALDEQGEWITDWVTWDGHPPFERGMFVAKVVGKSMESMIPDGAYCLFRAPRAGSREGRVVLVWHSGVSDPHTGGQYTVKVYSSEKRAKTDVEWEHARITLKPVNPAFEPILLEPRSEGDVRILAEFVGVVGS